MSTKLKGLEKENKKLQRRLWATEKRLTRSKTRKSTDGCPDHAPATDQEQMNTPATAVELMTPDSKSKRLLRRSALSPSKHTNIRKKLKLHYAMLKEVKSSGKLNEKINPLSVITGKISSLGISKRNAYKRREKVLAQETKKRLAKMRETQRAIAVQFFEADDNSTCLPGKKDFIIVDRKKIQKRILNDYMKNLYQKFLAMNPNLAISWGRFCQYRPKHITQPPSGLETRAYARPIRTLHLN